MPVDRDHLYILGVPNFASYEPAAALLRVPRAGGPIEYVCIAEDRLNRQKHSYTFPLLGIDHCLGAFGLESLHQIDFIYTDYARIPRWLNSGPGYRKLEHDYIKLKLDYPRERIRIVDHHDAHAASAFYPSGFEEAAVLVVDGLGSGLETQSLYHARDGRIELIERGEAWGIGRLYSLITGAVLPYGPEKGYGKSMGLAPYGASHPGPVLRFEANDRGMSSDYSAFFTRYPISRLVAPGVQRCTDRERVLDPYFARAAYDLQQECERQMLRMAEYATKRVGSRNLCLAGGVILNGLANSRILERLPYDRMFCQPACSDMGVPFGAAILGYFQDLAPAGGKRAVLRMKHAYAGRAYPRAETLQLLKKHGITALEATPEDVAGLLASGKIVAWFEGGSEFGPRALGHRSILADPRGSDMKDRLNSTVKFREGYRPYAPSILAEHAAEWLELRDESPFMLQVVPVRSEKRALVPAITHVDGTTRPQTVTAAESPNYHRLILAFHRLTGVPLLLNTSFNINREPIVETPEDALICSLGTGIDYLCLEGLLVDCAAHAGSELPRKLAAEREARLAQSWTALTRKHCSDYDVAERDLYLKEENLIADWHRDYRAKDTLERALVDWLASGARVLVVGTRGHSRALYLHVADVPALAVVGFAAMDDRPGERGQFSVWPDVRLADVDWSGVDTALISTHEYQDEALAAVRAAAPEKPVVALYDLAGDSLIYTLGNRWPTMNPGEARAHGLKATREAVVTSSNIDFDFAPSRITAVDRYAVAATYHWCHPTAGARFAGLHAVTPEAFEAQVKVLRQSFTLVSASALVDPGADLPETVALITIDDGLRDVYEHMLPVLRRWGLPATVFCSSAPLREGCVLNVHKVHLLQGKLGVGEFRRRFMAAFERMDSAAPPEDLDRLGIRKEALYPYDDPETRAFKVLLNYTMPYAALDEVLARMFGTEFGREDEAARHLYMSLDELRACQDAGLEIGLHTDRHRVLSRLSEAEQEIELARPVEALRDALGLKRLHLAYPYGHPGTWNNQTKRLLKKLDFESAYTLERRIVKPGDLVARWEIPRYSCSDLFGRDNALNTSAIAALSTGD